MKTLAAWLKINKLLHNNSDWDPNSKSGHKYWTSSSLEDHLERTVQTFGQRTGIQTTDVFELDDKTYHCLFQFFQLVLG